MKGPNSTVSTVCSTKLKLNLKITTNVFNLEVQVHQFYLQIKHQETYRPIAA